MENIDIFIKYALCLYIMTLPFVENNINFKYIKKIIFLSLVVIIFCFIYDPIISLLLTILMIIFIDLNYTKKKSEFISEIKSKNIENSKKLEKIIINDSNIEKKHVKESSIQESPKCEFKEDEIQKHFQNVEKKLKNIQDNVFDKYNYNIYYNEIQKEHYNIQGIGEDINNNISGFDSTEFF